MAKYRMELEGGQLRPVICRVGSKFRFRKMIDYVIPEHTKYVEPFIGSGAVFFYREPARDVKEVINDLDKGVIATYRLVQRVSPDVSKYPKDLNTIDKIKAFLRKPNKTPEEKLVEIILRRCNGFGGRVVNTEKDIYNDSNPYQKIRHIEDYKKRLANVKIENTDYANVIRKNDSPTTFFFMDPPYENTGNYADYAEEESFDFERFRDVVSKIRGKWLITINDSPRIRELFKNFNIYGWSVIPANQKGIGSKERKEVLISNYELPAGWRKYVPK